MLSCFTLFLLFETLRERVLCGSLKKIFEPEEVMSTTIEWDC